MARERLVLIAFGVALLTATNCSQDVATESLAGGFPPGEMGFGNPPEESFRAVMSDWNMAGRDIDCMVREMFPSSTDKTVTRSPSSR